MPTLMFMRRPSSVIGCSGSKSSRSAALTLDVVALLASDLVRLPASAGRTPPSRPAPARDARPRCRRSRRSPRAPCRPCTFAIASSFAAASFLIGNLRGHAAHRVRVAPVAGLDQQQRVGAHEGRRHRDLRAVGEAEVAVAAELLDAAEDVVPAAGVEARASARAARTGSRPSRTRRGSSRSAPSP